jgi:hypothetical protein
VSVRALIAEYMAKHGRSFAALQALLQASVAIAVPLGSSATIADLLDMLATEMERTL